MYSIITITLNPAIDKSTIVETLLPEKKLRCSSPVFEPGGGGINVARAIKKLGGEATALYPAGGHSGRFFTELLAKENVSSLVTEINDHTRENLIVLESSTNRQYRFGMPGPAINEKEWLNLLNALEQAESPNYIVCSGSLPPGMPAEVLAKIGEIAAKKKARYIVDTSGEALKMAITAPVFLLKPNLGELSFLSGKAWIKPEDIATTARTLMQKSNCGIMLVSMGKDGAMLVTENEVQHIIPPAVPKKSTVGAGDSMVAGIVLALANNKSLLEAAQYGVACGTAATMNPGTELCRKQDADHLFSLIRKKNQLHE